MLILTNAISLLRFFKSSLQNSISLNMWDLFVLLFSVFIRIVSILYVLYETIVDCFSYDKENKVISLFHC